MSNQFITSLTNGVTSALGGAPGALVSGLTGGLFDTLFGGIAANRQLKNQKKLMNHQYDLQKQMFDYTSEYNSMKNQVQRYKDAGLNPNLLTGQSQMAGTTGTISSGSAAMPLAQSQMQYAQHAQIASTTENLRADTDLKKSQVDLNTYLAIKEMYNGLEGKEKARVASVLADLSIDLARGELEHKKASTRLINQQSATEIAKQYNLSTSSALNIMKGITESLSPLQIFQSIKESDSRISQSQFYNAYLLSASKELDSRSLLNDSAMQEHFAGANLKNAQHIAQVLKNGDYEHYSEAEKAKLASEVYKNFYGGTYNPSHHIGLRQSNFYNKFNSTFYGY